MERSLNSSDFVAMAAALEPMGDVPNVALNAATLP